jgi:hypothetical protein
MDFSDDEKDALHTAIYDRIEFLNGISVVLPRFCVMA